MKGISSLGHIGIKVKDIDKSIAFYTEMMGFPEMFRLHRDDGRIEARKLPPLCELRRDRLSLLVAP
jgi:catechol 2,3-dioxygenase-like lactoylglutathione lyase family enzyme